LSTTEQAPTALDRKMARHHATADFAEAVEPACVFGRDSCFNVVTESLRQSGTLARGGNRYLQVSPADEGAIVEVATIGVVNGVAEDSVAFCFLVDGFVHLT